ncbi:sugar phosphate isomerase/epimerase family protein [Streptomyces sp. IBSBF 2435]|uniref:sugar phosphate isomerase/epimerase family protein n=1 Tax=Streptomyces sp. IBSBF 2435 TaxID=2903531 RepID=UPI002FDBE91D
MNLVTIQPRLHQLSEYVKMAQSEDFYLELIEPAYPENLDRLEEHFSKLLEGLPDGLAKVLHGPYIDIAVHTADREIREASRRRVAESLKWAKSLGVESLILHSNHLPMINEAGYDRQWLRGTLDFFESLDLGSVTVLIENMWDSSPDLNVELVERFDSEQLRLCFDSAHWNVYGRTSLDEWFQRAGKYTPYVQYGDNSGDHDADLALGSGNLDWSELDRCLRTYAPGADVMVGVGIDDGRRLTESLAFLRGHRIHPFPRLSAPGPDGE